MHKNRCQLSLTHDIKLNNPIPELTADRNDPSMGRTLFEIIHAYRNVFGLSNTNKHKQINIINKYVASANQSNMN